MTDPGRRPRALVTLPDVAWPVDGGKRLRCAGVLRGLSEVADVDVAVLHSRAPDDVPPVPPDVRVARWTRVSPEPLPRLRAALAAARGGLPVHVAAQRWDEVRRHLAAWTAGRHYDLVWFGGLDHASALHDDLPASVRLVDCDDVETEKWRAYLRGPATGVDRVERLQRRVELPLWGRVQRDVLRWADVVVVCSDVDARRLRGCASGGRPIRGRAHVAVVPNTYPDPAAVTGTGTGLHARTRLGHDTPRHPPSNPVALVVANYATPQNQDAARAAAHGLLPELRARHPHAGVRLVGRDADRLEDLRGLDGLDLVGPVPAVAGELAAATAVVVPMRFGGGTRLKVLEAFAHGVPVVSTSLGCEGVGAVDGEHLLVADSAAAMADAVMTLHADPLRARQLAGAARRHYERHFTPAASTTAVAEVVSSALTAGRPAR
ncbi:glycosyltransferase [Pseudokineococcus sp. 1T1Z-3]|uniref:glycosyltransferase n=1 Tax=Pseudokineococcus sp. 1T1Z-3 TaxID=3132745 RepID=UPI0030ABD9AF